LTLNGLRNGDGILFGSDVERGAANTWSPAADYTEWFDGANDGGPASKPTSSTGIRRIVTASGNYTPSSTSSGNGVVLSVAVAFHPAEEVLGGPIFW
jgi:hypothetical protein